MDLNHWAPVEQELHSGAYGIVTDNVALKDLTSFHIGGPCKLLVEPTSEKELVRTVRFLRVEGVPFYVLGNGSNILATDEGYEGVLIHLGKNFSDCCLEGGILRTQAGASLKRAAELSFQESLTGMEQVSGIPGTVGGAVIMNAGAYGKEMKDLVVEVKAIDQQGQILTLTKDELDFSYRSSRLMKEGMIAVDVAFALEKGDFQEIEAAYQDYTQRRTSKQPLDKHSAGSTFKRPVGGYASKLIDDAGLRGLAVGDAQVSEKHCGFLINNGQASFQDMETLIHKVQAQVYRQFGISLETEVRLLGPKGELASEALDLRDKE